MGEAEFQPRDDQPEDPLAELAQAAAELDPPEGVAGPQGLQLNYQRPNRASSRQRKPGKLAHGVVTVALAGACWAMTLGSLIVDGNSLRWGMLEDWFLRGAVGTGLAAVILGTIAARREPGRTLALIGRALAWMTPIPIAIGLAIIRFVHDPDFSGLIAYLIGLVILALFWAGLGWIFGGAIDAIFD